MPLEEKAGQANPWVRFGRCSWDLTLLWQLRGSLPCRSKMHVLVGWIMGIIVLLRFLSS